MATFRSRQHGNGIPYDVFPPERASAARRLNAGAAPEIVDAEFIVLSDVRARRAGMSADNDSLRTRMASASAPTSASRSRTIDAASVVEHALRTMPLRAFATLVGMVFLLVFLAVGGVNGLGRLVFPEPLGLAELDVTHVTLAPRDSNGMRVLLLNGILENRTDHVLSPAKVRADLVSGDRLIASTLIDLPMETIQPGQSRGFSARLPHPGGKTPDVRVSVTMAAVSPS